MSGPITMTRRGLARAGLLVAVIAALLAPVTASAHGSSKTTSTPVPVLAWGPCDGDVAPVYECVTAKVPLDYKRPRGKTVELALTRQPASDQAHKIGSVFLAHPLGMFDFIAEAPPGALAAFTRFDVIGYDGRGIGRARPALDCHTDRELMKAFGTAEKLDVPAMVKAADKYGKQCEKAAGDLLPHLSTMTMARDLDLLRQAVGDTKLTYIGISQGTVIGATYASMFPGRVRAMVFDAVVDVPLWVNDPMRAFREQTAETEKVLTRFLDACAAHRDTCEFGAGKPRAAFDKLIKRLDRQPQPSPDPADPFPVNGDDVRAAALEMSYSPTFWAPFARGLADAERGDYTTLRRQARNGFGSGGVINDPVTPSFNLWYANVAADGRFPHKVKDFVRYGLENRQRFPHFGAGFDLLIPGRWPAEQAEVFRGPFRNPASNPPILMIGGTHDGATPYHWAQRMTEQLGNARLLTFDSDGHGALNDGDPCVLIPVFTFLTDGTTLPPAGTVCTQRYEPFGG